MGKFIDVGVKQKDSMAVSVNSPNKEKSYPTLYLDVIPEGLANEDVGHECTIECKVVITSKNHNQDKDGKKENMVLKVKQIAYDTGAEDKAGSGMKRMYKAMKGLD